MLYFVRIHTIPHCKTKCRSRERRIGVSLRFALVVGILVAYSKWSDSLLHLKERKNERIAWSEIPFSFIHDGIIHLTNENGISLEDIAQDDMLFVFNSFCQHDGTQLSMMGLNLLPSTRSHKRTKQKGSSGSGLHLLCTADRDLLGRQLVTWLQDQSPNHLDI